jgi:hypothetical protein
MDENYMLTADTALSSPDTVNINVVHAADSLIIIREE